MLDSVTLKIGGSSFSNKRYGCGCRTEQEKTFEEEKGLLYELDTTGWFAGAAGRLSSLTDYRPKYSGDQWHENIENLQPSQGANSL